MIICIFGRRYEFFGFCRMTEKVDNMEADIERIVAKIDAVFRKMKKMEGKRREKREKMDKIFDPKRRESCIRNEL